MLKTTQESSLRAKMAIIPSNGKIPLVTLALLLHTGSAVSQDINSTNKMGDILNNQGIVTQGQRGNNIINNYGPPRRWVPEYVAMEIASSLKEKNPSGVIEVQTMMQTCADCDSFAKQIESVLRAAPNLQVKPVRDGIGIYGFTGSAIWVRDTKSIPLSAKAIIEAFKSVGATLTPVQHEIKDGVDAILVVAQPSS